MIHFSVSIESVRHKSKRMLSVTSYSSPISVGCFHIVGKNMLQTQHKSTLPYEVPTLLDPNTFLKFVSKPQSADFFVCTMSIHHDNKKMWLQNVCWQLNAHLIHRLKCHFFCINYMGRFLNLTQNLLAKDPIIICHLTLKWFE